MKNFLIKHRVGILRASAITIFFAFAGVAAYLGIWLLFIGGIVQVVEAVKATPVSALGIAIGLFRCLVAQFCWIIVYIGFIFSFRTWRKSIPKRKPTNEDILRQSLGRVFRNINTR